MQLVTLHKIMIGAAIGMSLLMAIWSGWMYGREGSALHVAMAAGSLGIAGALGAYLRYFMRRTRDGGRK
jgi:hypothetical protein